MSIKLSIEAIIGRPLKNKEPFIGADYIKAPGLYIIIEKNANEWKIINSSGNCRDSFFRKLNTYLSDKCTPQLDFINIGLAIPSNNVKKYILNYINDFIKQNLSIPYVDRIAFELDTNEFKIDMYYLKNNASAKSLVDSLLYIGPEEQNLSIYFLNMYIPIQLFADPAIIWALTYELRRILHLYGNKTDYAKDLDPFLNLLRNNYYDLILTDKKELIYNMWQQCGGLDSELLNWNGPYGINSWLTVFKNSNSLFQHDQERYFYRHHKYLNVELLNRSKSK